VILHSLLYAFWTAILALFLFGALRIGVVLFAWPDFPYGACLMIASLARLFCWFESWDPFEKPKSLRRLPEG